MPQLKMHKCSTLQVAIERDEREIEVPHEGYERCLFSLAYKKSQILLLKSKIPKTYEVVRVGSN